MSKSRLARLSSQEVAELQEKLRTAEERIAQLTAPGEYGNLIRNLRHQAAEYEQGDMEAMLNEAADAIEQLQAKLRETEAALDTATKANAGLSLLRNQAEARVRELEPDAERYRTVRAMIGEFPQSHWYIPSYGMVKTPEEFDAAVDRAARKEPT